MAEHIAFDDNVRKTGQAIRNTQTAATNVYRTGIDVFTKGLEGIIEVQSHLLDVAARQNTEAFDAWKQAFATSTEQMFRLAQQTFGQLIQTQKSVVGLAHQQGEEVADAARSEGERTMRTAQRATDWATAQGESAQRKERGKPERAKTAA